MAHQRINYFRTSVGICPQPTSGRRKRQEKKKKKNVICQKYKPNHSLAIHKTNCDYRKSSIKLPHRGGVGGGLFNCRLQERAGLIRGLSEGRLVRDQINFHPNGL